MSATTGIEWTDATWNPIRGCSRVSEGCRHCYAETVANRFCGPGKPYEGLVQLDADGKGSGKWNGAIKFVEKHLLDPLRWKTGRRIFVNSMSDLFHENATDQMLDQIFAVMALCPQHTFQVLTKRPERMAKYFAQGSARRMRTTERMANIWDALRPKERAGRSLTLMNILPNLWLGVSVESKTVAMRIQHLRHTSAAVRFLSIEPLIAEVGDLDLDGIAWVICGGESGPGARPMHPDWARSVRDQCVTAGVPFFFKQWGEWGVTGRERHLFRPSQSRALLGFTTVCSSERKSRGEHTFVALPEIPADLETASAAGGWVEFERLRRVGKKAAGNLLDGQLWQQYPGVAA